VASEHREELRGSGLDDDRVLASEVSGLDAASKAFVKTFEARGGSVLVMASEISERDSALVKGFETQARAAVR
jgi:hypothetical protein